MIITWLGTWHNAIIKNGKQVAEVLSFNQYWVVRYYKDETLGTFKTTVFNDAVKFLNKHFKGWSMP